MPLCAIAKVQLVESQISTVEIWVESLIRFLLEMGKKKLKKKKKYAESYKLLQLCFHFLLFSFGMKMVEVKTHLT